MALRTPSLFYALSPRLGKTLRMAATRKRHWPTFAARERKRVRDKAAAS